MYKQFRHIIILAILLTGVLRVLAQPFAMPDKVCVETIRRYWVDDGLPGSVFTWKIDGKIFQNTATEFIDYKWLVPGIFNLEVQEHQPNCDGEIKIGTVTVVPVPVLQPVADVAVCGNYSLPKITGTGLSGNEAYYDDSRANGGKQITGPITKSQLVWIYDETGTNPNCSDEINFNVQIFDPPTAFAGSAATICPGISFILNDATATNFSTLLWTKGSGDGTFDDPTILKAIYTPGPNDLASGTVTLTLTAQGMGSTDTCTPAVSSVSLDILRLEATAVGTDITCFGANNGIITISGQVGGSGNYEYRLNVGSATGIWLTSPEINNISPGVYNIQMRDVLVPVCIRTIGNIEIKEPELLSATVTSTQTSCLGNDGTITLTNPKGGWGNHEFQLKADTYTSTWQASRNFNGLLPDIYEVWIRDAVFPDCMIKLQTIEIKKPDPIIAQPVSKMVTCWDGLDGEIAITEAKNGSGKYEYSIDDGTTWRLDVFMPFTNLPAGKYILLMRDYFENICIKNLGEITITQPDALFARADKTDISCFGAKDGQISISNTMGGTSDGRYEFSIDGGTSWTTTTMFTQLPAKNSYIVLMRDELVPLCYREIARLEMIEPPQIRASVRLTNVSCYLAGDGKLEIYNEQYGQPPYQYKMGNGSWTSNATFAGLKGGNYQLRIRDAKGCEEDLGLWRIVEPKPLTADVAYTDATCLGNDGTITISNPLNSVSNLYDYSIDGGTAWTKTTLFTQLEPKTYTVMIRDANLTSCQQTLETIPINAPVPLKASAVRTNITCFGANDGTITIKDQSGGSTLYQYSIDNMVWYNEALFTKLPPADYTVWMRDRNASQCYIEVGKLTIVEPVQLSALALPEHVTCFGGNDGQINMTNELGGSGKYQYSVNGIDWVTNKLVKLIAGTYTIQMRDAATVSCIVSLGQLVIRQPEKLIAEVKVTDARCFDSNDGTLTMTNPQNGSGAGSYQFRVDGGAWIAHTSTQTVINNRVPGNHTLEIQDALMSTCTASLGNYTINKPEELKFTYTRTHETLPDKSDGSITITSTKGGFAPYLFSIDGINWQAALFYSNLSPKKYEVQMRDAKNCIVKHEIDILPVGSLTAEFKISPVTCFGGSDGSITFFSPLGAINSNYEFSPDGISWGAVNQLIFTGLSAKVYKPMVRDADYPSNESSLTSYKIDQPTVLQATTVNVGSESFAGAGNGSITISGLSGGSGQYEFSINPPDWQASPVFTGLSARPYVIWVRDAKAPGCTVSYQKVMQPAGSITADFSFTNNPCYGDNKGTISITGSGGSGTFNYSINNGASWQSSGSFTGLAAGGYTLRLQDANMPSNVVSLGVVTIAQPPRLTTQIISVEPPICIGERGWFTVSASGGTPAYLGEGNYIVPAGVEVFPYTITDSNGCSTNELIRMPLPKKIEVSATIDQPDCYGETGTVTISATGGTGALSVDNMSLVSGKLALNVQSGLPYSFVVTDSNGCKSDVVSGIMPPLEKLVVKAMPVSSLCFGGNTTVSVTASGGSPAYTGTGIFSVLAGTHTFTVTDAKGCSASVALVIQAISPPETPTATASTPCENGVLTLGGAPDGMMSYLWTGPNAFSSATQTPTITGVKLSGEGIYTLLITNSAGCSATSTVNVTINSLPPAVAGSNSPVCENGTLNLTGTPAEMVKYEWSGPNGFTSLLQNPSIPNVSLSFAGTYTLTVTNTSGCSASSIVPVTINLLPLPLAKANTTCENEILFLTGSPNFMAKYEWIGPNGFTSVQQSPTIPNVSMAASGTYTLTVTNAKGCLASAMVGATVHPLPILVANSIAPTCLVADGSIEVTSPLGSNFQYKLDGGVYTSVTTFAHLAPGSTHTLTVRDVLTGCVSLPVSRKIDLMPVIPGIPVAIVTVKPTCNNPDGTVVVTSPVGPEYEYTIGGRTQTSTIFANIKTGTYSITVRNTKTECKSAPGSVVVPAIPPSPVLALVSKENPLCFGDLGSITLSMTNTPDGLYTIKYIGGQFSNVPVSKGQAKIEVPDGSYSIITIEVKGCTSDEIINVVITQPSEIAITETITEIDLKSRKKGAINISISGGSPFSGVNPYQIQWSNGPKTQDIKDLDEGTYTVFVTDKNGCTQIKSIKVPAPNYPPVARNDEFIAGCTGASGNLFSDNGKGIDYDPENDPFFVDVKLIVEPQYGTVVINPDLMGTFTYVANPGYTGDDSFQYAIYDKNHYQGDTAAVTIRIVADFDGDGVTDALDPDADADGILNIDEILAGQDWRIADSDGDEHPNWLDIDADNDGIIDNVEAQSWSGYLIPSEMDKDGDGLDDAYDTSEGGTVLKPIDTDADKIPDFLDADSDNDLVADYIEGHDRNADGRPDRIFLGNDTDSDGLDDVYDTIINGCNNGNAIGSNTAPQDFDGDGMPDWRDENDDNDEYLTRFEDLNADNDFSNDDVDFDGHPEYLDYGRDCDLFVPDAFSPNNDNIHDYFQVYCIDNFPNAKMYIFDQLGNKLYEQDHYGNLKFWGTNERAWWDGKTTNRSAATKNGGKVAVGTYYYVFQLGNGEVKKSFVFVSY